MESKCKGREAIYNNNSPEIAECRDCASTVQVDANGKVMPHVTGDPLCFASEAAYQKARSLGWTTEGWA